jgi:predicted nucleic acid-binding protein
MKILDTNVWVYAFTGESSRAFELVEEIARGDAETVVDTYLYLEVISAFERSEHLDHVDVTEAQDQFGQFVWSRRFETVHAEIDDDAVPQRADVMTKLEALRIDSYNRLVARILQVQAKDAPVVHLAYQAGRDTHVFTNDSGFASLAPANYSLPKVSMEHVRRNPDATESTISDVEFD